ncbi:hypothetical protein [Actinophytocola xinjiangensis]|uniref:hypothetical protein n=1 Tax=Actinophytocola xinjiangensis TaxID=485602 RepID=UPI000B2511FA|nr:hypothetical protein [Actinophytocola xinjiangensis]
MNHYVFHDAFDDDVDGDVEGDLPERDGTTAGYATRVEIAGGLGRVGVQGDDLAIDLDEQAIRTTPADRIGDHLTRAVNTAFDADTPHRR